MVIQQVLPFTLHLLKGCWKDAADSRGPCLVWFRRSSVLATWAHPSPPYQPFGRIETILSPPAISCQGGACLTRLDRYAVPGPGVLGVKIRA